MSDERELELIHRVDHLVSQVKNVNYIGQYNIEKN